MASMYCKVDYVNETIFVNKPFMKAAGIVGSKEYEELLAVRHDNPTFTVELRTITKNGGKQTHHGLDYAKMEEHIRRTHPDDEQHMALFEDVKYRASFSKGSYAIVKKWFLERYGKELEIPSVDEEVEDASVADNIVPMNGMN